MTATPGAITPKNWKRLFSGLWKGCQIRDGLAESQAALTESDRRVDAALRVAAARPKYVACQGCPLGWRGGFHSPEKIDAPPPPVA